MTKIITGPKDVLITWLRHRTGYRPASDMRCLGIVRDGVIGAVIGYDNFNGSAIEMHVASDGSRQWMTKSLLRAAFHYPFNVCDAKVILGMVPSRNFEAVKMSLKLGFLNVASIKDGHPDGNLYLMAMWRENCRYLRGPDTPKLPD